MMVALKNCCVKNVQCWMVENLTIKWKKCLFGYQEMFKCDHYENLQLPGLQELRLNYDLLLAHS